MAVDQKYRERRAAQLSWDEQMRLDHEARRATARAKIDDFQRDVDAYRERGVLPPHVQPVKPLEELYGVTTAQEKAAQLEAKKQQVREQLTDPNHWVNQLPMTPQRREALMRQKFAQEAIDLGLAK